MVARLLGRPHSAALLVVSTLLLLALPRPGSAQGLGPTLGGAGAGLLAGGATSLGALALLAQDDRYVWGWAELAGWPAVPMALGMVGGGIQGAVASDRLGPALGYATAGAALFGGLGWGLGPALFGEERGRWAGLLAGIGTGVVVGWTLGTVLSGDETPRVDSPSVVFDLRIPIG